MTVAFHISEDPFAVYGGNFNFNIAVALATINTVDHFILIYDSVPPPVSVPANCTIVQLSPLIKNNLSKYYWYNIKLPAVLKKYSVDIFFPHHGSFCSSTSVKQFFVIHDKSDVQTKLISKAAVVLQTVPDNFKLNRKIIETRFGFDKSFKPLSFSEKETIKQRFSEEREYFFTRILPADNERMRTLLKSFSHFKKWQRSSLKLIILTDKNPVADLHLYKFRADVKIIFEKDISVSERSELISASYATIAYDQIAAIAAVKCSSPVIYISSSENLYGDAMLYALQDEKNISKQMIHIYKDEQLRNSIIEESALLSSKYTWENTAVAVNEAIESCMQ